MAATFSAYYPASPLADCTNAIDNAENISSNGRLQKPGKPYTPLSTLRNVSYTLDPAVVAAQQQQQKEPAPAARPAPLNPGISSSPMRHDPYSSCIVNSPMTPYDSFVASYADYCDPAELATPTAATRSGCAVPAPRSALFAAQQQPLPPVAEKASTPPHVSQDGGASSTNTSVTNNSSNSAATTPVANRTIVKTVVSCSIDRTTGRPIPVRRQA